MGPHKGSLSVGVFRIDDSDCPGCAERVSKSLKSMDGVLDVGINYVTDKVYVTYDPLVLARAQVRRTIEDASRGEGETREGEPAGATGSAVRVRGTRGER